MVVDSKMVSTQSNGYLCPDFMPTTTMESSRTPLEMLKETCNAIGLPDSHHSGKGKTILPLDSHPPTTPSKSSQSESRPVSLKTGSHDAPHSASRPSPKNASSADVGKSRGKSGAASGISPSAAKMPKLEPAVGGDTASLNGTTSANSSRPGSRDHHHPAPPTSSSAKNNASSNACSSAATTSHQSTNLATSLPPTTTTTGQALPPTLPPATAKCCPLPGGPTSTHQPLLSCLPGIPGGPTPHPGSGAPSFPSSFLSPHHAAAAALMFSSMQPSTPTSGPPGLAGLPPGMGSAFGSGLSPNSAYSLHLAAAAAAMQQQQQQQHLQSSSHAAAALAGAFGAPPGASICRDPFCKNCPCPPPPPPVSSSSAAQLAAFLAGSSGAPGSNPAASMLPLLYSAAAAGNHFTAPGLGSGPVPPVGGGARCPMGCAPGSCGGPASHLAALGGAGAASSAPQSNSQTGSAPDIWSWLSAYPSLLSSALAAASNTSSANTINNNNNTNPVTSHVSANGLTSPAGNAQQQAAAAAAVFAALAAQQSTNNNINTNNNNNNVTATTPPVLQPANGTSAPSTPVSSSTSVVGCKSPVTTPDISKTPAATTTAAPLPNTTCHWVSAETNNQPCGRRFASSEELFQHVRTAHTSPATATTSTPTPSPVAPSPPVVSQPPPATSMALPTPSLAALSGLLAANGGAGLAGLQNSLMGSPFNPLLSFIGGAGGSNPAASLSGAPSGILGPGALPSSTAAAPAPGRAMSPRSSYLSSLVSLSALNRYHPYKPNGQAGAPTTTTSSNPLGPLGANYSLAAFYGQRLPGSLPHP